MNYDKSKLAKRLRDLREEKRISQKELSEILGISRPNIGKYENAQVDLSTEILFKIAEFFNVTTDYLLGRTDFRNVEILKEKEIPPELLQNTELLEGDQLPPELRGIIDKVGILKGTGLSEQDIENILQLHAEIERKKKQDK